MKLKSQSDIETGLIFSFMKIVDINFEKYDPSPEIKNILLESRNHICKLQEIYKEIYKKQSLKYINITSEETLDIITKYKITDVIPTLHETLLGWSKKKEYFKDLGCTIHISPPSTLEIFLDKWTTFNFFKENKLPTPNTSLDNIYPLTKPRSGRGAIGIQLNKVDREMTGLISQEVCLGREVTIDVFVYNNKPLYIVPRNRDKIVSGKSTASSIFKNDKIMKKNISIIKIKKPLQGPFIFLFHD
jgi:hypothetical protein